MSIKDYIEFQEHEYPLGYLITMRTYGTWLHGDERGAMDRRHFHRYGAPKIPTSLALVQAETRQLKHPPVTLNNAQRAVIETAIREVCQHRGYHLRALNARTNHVHSVVTAGCKPERIMDAFKAYATRCLREQSLLTQAKLW
jgi:hypothetical protein